MLPVFIHFSDIGIALFQIQPSARGKKLSQHGSGIRLFCFVLFFRLSDRTTDNFCLGNLPVRGKPLEALGRGCVQCKGRAVRHGLHTIFHTITFSERQGKQEDRLTSRGEKRIGADRPQALRFATLAKHSTFPI